LPKERNLVVRVIIKPVMRVAFKQLEDRRTTIKIYNTVKPRKPCSSNYEE